MTDLNSAITLPTSASLSTLKARKVRKDKGVKKASGKRARARKSGVKPAKQPNMSGVMQKKYYDRYRKLGGNCGDALAVALKSAVTTIDKGKSGKANRPVFDRKAMLAIARENKIDCAPYLNVNNGMLRMDVSNKMRALPVALINGKKYKNDDAE